ncbi:hypothetical protein LA345_13120 [Burkholderia vietnamiensis]|nr:hypothetical protein [Burkholderia vietnamiensis]
MTGILIAAALFFFFWLMVPREPSYDARAALTAQKAAAKAEKASKPGEPWSAPKMGLFGGLGLFSGSIVVNPVFAGLAPGPSTLYMALSLLATVLSIGLALGTFFLRMRAALREDQTVDLIRKGLADAVVALPVALLCVASMFAATHFVLWR